MEIRTPQDDERLMSLVTLALAQPENQRESYLASACSGNAGLFSQAWNYVQWEVRMQGFLLDPLIPPAEDETPFEPGQLLDGRFRIVREVARGGMGIVYEAFDEKLVRCIALKCAKSGFRKRLPPEVRHASEISHPNVCKIFEIHTASTEDGEVDFLTMEFLDGETLAARLSRGPLPEAEARAIGGQICAGLAEAHRNWVVHGDLKSNNVILTQDAGGGVRAVITDFGLASVPVGPAEDIGFGALGPSQAAGTPDYMAPELWKGEKPSAASDVYALGVILYELTTGQRPSPPADRLKQKPPAVRHGRDPIVRRCLDPNPTGRFRDAVEVAAALDTRRSRQRWTRAAAAIVFAAIALAAVSGLVTYERTTAPKESVRLAMLPLELVTDGAGPDVAGMAEQISHKAADELARLKGGTLKRLSVVPRNEVFGRHVDTVEKARSALGATHVVWGTIALKNRKVTVHAFLTDTKTQANSGEWRAEYAPGEVRYAPVAMAGMVTAALHLPPLTEGSVNASAKQDYLKGLAYTHRNSTVEQALPLLQSAVAADSDSPLTWAGLAEAQWFKKYITQDPVWLAEASESLRQAQNRNPDLAPVHRVAGLLRANAGLNEEAEAEYLRAIELDSANGDAYRRLGRVYEKTNRLEKALAVLKKAVEVGPNDFKAYQDLGAYYSLFGPEREAVRPLERCVQLAPDEPDAHRALGAAYQDLERYTEAERELRTAVQLAETPAALVNLANTMMYQQRYPEAIPHLERAVKLSPNYVLAWMNLGIAYSLAKRPRDAKTAFLGSVELAKIAMERNPKDGELRSRLAYLLARLGETKRAEEEIVQALSFSDSSVTRGMAVWTYEFLKKPEKAVDILSKSSPDVLRDTSRWPGLAELRKNPRFKGLLDSHK
jgi:tetratricopeptide (TPR) repeat protein/TolB-like protein